MLAVLGLAISVEPLTLTARVVVPRGAAMPAVIEARIAGTDVQCPVTGTAARCDVPAGTQDVRFSAEGFAPVYVWGIEGVDAGELRFRRGVAITGYARPSGRDEPADAIDVELRPAAIAWSPDDKQRSAAAARIAKTNARGFFRFDAVEPGEYVVAAKKAGWSPAAYRVHVSGVTNETTVGKELVLDALARIEVWIQPPVDARQRPWLVTLDRILTGDQQQIADSAASITGQWSHDRLESGAYAVSIRDADGSRVAGDGLYAAGGTSHMAITIDQVPVRGTLTLDGEPVVAWLRFLDMFGKRVDMDTDEKGKFTGVLPVQGPWDVEIRRGGAQSRVSIPDLDVRRLDSGYAELDLELPEGKLHGTVTSSDGRPVKANVKVWHNHDFVASALTEDDGKFSFTGVPPDEVEISAEGKGTKSGIVRHTIAGLDDEPIRLVVEKPNTVRARVLTPDGRPVAGALVSWVTTNVIKDDLTGPRGEIRFALPHSTTEIDLFVLAIGFPLKIATIPVSGDVAEIRLPAVAGLLYVAFDNYRPPYPRIGKGERLMPFGVLFGGGGPDADGMPVRSAHVGAEVVLEPGEYTVCSTYKTKCETRVVRAGGRESVDTTGWQD
ncbi:MAG TPA: carboxypeptidase regulatory-like domain-containing protein [Thermoanaerobaculia bacterium]|nr:carboxypeptidase regulatory-like domain-containing protein [Thermoanaerobaculia bacterium]